MIMRKCIWIALGLCLLLFAECGKTVKRKLDTSNIPLDHYVSVYIEAYVGNITIEPGTKKSIQIEPSFTITASSKERRTLLKENILVNTDTSDPSILALFPRLSNNVSLRDDESVEIH